MKNGHSIETGSPHGTAHVYCYSWVSLFHVNIWRKTVRIFNSQRSDAHDPLPGKTRKHLLLCLSGCFIVGVNCFRQFSQSCPLFQIVMMQTTLIQEYKRALCPDALLSLCI